MQQGLVMGSYPSKLDIATFVEIAFDRFTEIKWGAITTSSQCYKTFTGLYLQVCKYRAIFNIIYSHYYCQIHEANARQRKYLVFNIENKHEQIGLGNNSGYR